MQKDITENESNFKQKEGKTYSGKDLPEIKTQDINEKKENKEEVKKEKLITDDNNKNNISENKK